MAKSKNKGINVITIIVILILIIITVVVTRKIIAKNNKNEQVNNETNQIENQVENSSITCVPQATATAEKNSTINLYFCQYFPNHLTLVYFCKT